MGELTVILWHDLPAQIIVRAGRKTAKRALPERFQEAIDHAAMRVGAKDSDAYLAAWRRSEPTACGDDAEAEADAALAVIDQSYDRGRLASMIANGGFEAAAEELQPLVVFSPSGKRGRVKAGTSVLDAARLLGVDLDSVCGGRGICGRCQIEIANGHDAKIGITSRESHCSPLNEVEQRYARLRSLADRRRLGCQASIEADVIIDVPAESQLHRQIIRKAASLATVTLDPAVRLYFVSVSEPCMEQARSDLSRLKDALSQQWGFKETTFPPSLLGVLQPILRQGEWQVTVAMRHGREIVALYPGLKEQIAGIAIDIGSTTIAGHLCDLSTGKVLASAGVMNPQIRFGEDVMSRVSYAMMNESGARDMTSAVRHSINQLIRDLCGQAGLARQDVVDLVMVGNPIMHHLLLGIDPRELGAAPFALASDEGLDIAGRELGLDVAPGAYVHVLPCIAGHVGADASAMILAEAPHDSDGLTLLVDVGTNAEIVLGNRERLLACSSPTGPAFEGAQLSSGQRAAPGAIERISIDPQSLEPRFKVIGVEPWSDEDGFDAAVRGTGITGLCGSAIIDVIAELALAGIIRPDGVFDGDVAGRSARIGADGRSFKYVVHDGPPMIAVTQADVRAVQLAKAALHAGCKLLMSRFGVTRVERIRLAGAFGAHIDPLHALVLGLVPDCALDQVSAAGNAAGDGAMIALLNSAARTAIAETVRGIEKVETALDPLFQSEFVAAMAIPHASDPYEETARHVRLPERMPQRAGRRKRS